MKNLTLGERIKNIRKLLKMNQAVFAKEIGLESAMAVSAYENNQTEPDISKLIKISKLGNISLDELLTGEKTSIYNKEESRGSASIIKDFCSLEYSAQKAENNFKLSDAIKMCADVLESGTSYAGALYHNLVHFDRAVKNEQLHDECKEDLKAVNKTLSEMRTRMDEMDDANKKLQNEVKKLQGSSGGSAPFDLSVDHAAPSGTDDKEI